LLKWHVASCASSQEVRQWKARSSADLWVQREFFYRESRGWKTKYDCHFEFVATPTDDQFTSKTCAGSIAEAQQIWKEATKEEALIMDQTLQENRKPSGWDVESLEWLKCVRYHRLDRKPADFSGIEGLEVKGYGLTNWFCGEVHSADQVDQLVGVERWGSRVFGVEEFGEEGAFFILHVEHALFDGVAGDEFDRGDDILLTDAVGPVGLEGSQLAGATLGSVRLRLLKVAAVVHVSVRRVHVALCSAFPLQDVFRLAASRLQTCAPPTSWKEPGRPSNSNWKPDFTTPAGSPQFEKTENGPGRGLESPAWSFAHVSIPQKGKNRIPPWKKSNATDPAVHSAWWFLRAKQ
jgi:hypothetical protein